MRLAMMILSLGLTLSLGAITSAKAGIFFHRHEEKPHPTPEPGTPRHICHTMAHAGFPNTLAKHLEPTNAGDSYGYYVGGGGGHSAGLCFFCLFAYLWWGMNVNVSLVHVHLSVGRSRTKSTSPSHISK